VPGTEFEIPADLVFLAMGFTGPRLAGAVRDSGVELTPQGNVKATMTDYRTSRDRVFACGDMRRGQSLVVWAIREGRDCAAAVDAFLTAEREQETVLARSA
jgi:glutamate synthase (NADPH/NADH) small chain